MIATVTDRFKDIEGVRKLKKSTLKIYYDMATELNKKDNEMINSLGGKRGKT